MTNNISCSSPQKFTGKERDAETGLDFFLARYYSGAQGRFLSPDEFKGGPDDALTGRDITPPGPLPYADIGNPQSLNKYAYVLNNPLKYTDPDGHKIKYLGTDGPPTDDDMIAVLESVDRQNGNKDVYVTSGYRSPATNGNTKGAAKRSYHLTGEAADFYVPGQTPKQTAAQAVKAGAMGVSTYNTGTPRVHADVRPKEWNAHNGKTLTNRPEWRINPDKVLEIKKAPQIEVTVPRLSLWQLLKETIKSHMK